MKVSKKMEDFYKKVGNHGSEPWLMVGADRLDYTKGIPERIRGYELMLKQHPELRTRVTYLQLAAPSRTHIDDYRNLNEHLDDLVDAVNWQYQTENWLPIHFLKSHHDYFSVLAAYRLAHAVIVSALHDGMNLVAKEFVSARTDGDGTLIPSQYTGASRELTEAILVNPYDTQALADSIYGAYTMPEGERRRRMAGLRCQVKQNDVFHWGEKIISDIMALQYQNRAVAVWRHRRGKRLSRIVWIFDFDGTLSPIVAERYAARLHPACRELLKKLSRDHENHVAVLSSRRLEVLTPRIDIPGLYLGGYNGLKWLSPEGRVLDHGHDFPGDLEQTRDVMLPGIMALNELPGMDIEDKHWAVTLHLRHLSSDLKEEVSQRILGWETGDRVRLLKGPEAWEIVFSPTFDKSVGVRILCRILGFDPHLERLIYTGDDENDALAMAYVTSQGGINITIRPRPLVPGAHIVENPKALPSFCRKLLTSIIAKDTKESNS
jgi:trehalose-phosphatase